MLPRVTATRRFRGTNETPSTSPVFPMSIIVTSGGSPRAVGGFAPIHWHPLIWTITSIGTESDNLEI